MEKKKFSKANLLYVFSMFLGLTIIVLGFSVANNAKKELKNQAEMQQEVRQQVQTDNETAAVSKPAEKVVKEKTEQEVVVLTQAEQKPQEDEFAPNLENHVIEKPADGEISRSFTGSSLVYSELFDEWSVHKGVDIAAAQSAQVRAVANGTVKSVYKDNRTGITIVIQHGDFTTVYGNLSTDELVKEGDKVYAGDIVSGVGKSADGKEYLHFEINYKGEDIDPEPLLVR